MFEFNIYLCAYEESQQTDLLLQPSNDQISPTRPASGIDQKESRRVLMTNIIQKYIYFSKSQRKGPYKGTEYKITIGHTSLKSFSDNILKYQ
jgi:hypothetical protein